MRGDAPRAGVVGPNAILQSAAALRAEAGEPLVQRVFAQAGLDHMLLHPPDKMVAERDAAALHRAMGETLDWDRALAVARDAGRLTGEYILAHRIPPRAQAVLRALPRALAGPVLLMAIRRHAWTFAGSGAVSITAYPMTLTITANPLAVPGCPWHCAVLQTLFRRLVSERIEVHASARKVSGDTESRFHFEWPRGRLKRSVR